MLRSISIQLVVFTCIFLAVSFLREIDMLSTFDNVSAPIYQVETLAHENMALKAHGKKTIVYFFAPWCTVCELSIDNLQKTYQASTDIDVIAVALDYVDEQQVKTFTDKHQLTFPIALGKEAIKKDYKIKGYPSYYVLNAKNEIIAKSMGYSSQFGLYLRSLF